jgi:hypothetical protein
LKSTLQQAAGNLLGKDFIYLIRSLTPQQATGNALAIAVHGLFWLLQQTNIFIKIKFYSTTCEGLQQPQTVIKKQGAAA